MTVVPTPESNFELIEELQGAVYEAHVQPTGAEYSFPALGRGVDSNMFRQMMKAFGSGVIDYGGHPFRLVTSAAGDANNTITIEVESGTGRNEAVIEGYFYRQSEPVTLTVPGVTSATEISVALQFDFARFSQPEGPIRLGVFTGELDRTQGKKYVVLHRGTRLPSTVPSQIDWVEVRPRVVPRILVDHPSYLPSFRDGLLWGTEATVHTTGETVQFRGNESGGSWRSLSNPEWTDLYLPSARYHPGFGWQPASRLLPSGQYEVRGRLRRGTQSAPAVWQRGQSYLAGSIRGVSSSGLPQTTLTVTGQGEFLVELNGDIRFTPSADVTTISLDQVKAWAS